MPEIVGQSDNAKRKTCANCGAKLKYWPRDVKEVNGRDIGGGPDGCRYIICPQCGEKVVLDSW